jgi:hypothetical protein
LFGYRTQARKCSHTNLAQRRRSGRKRRHSERHRRTNLRIVTSLYGIAIQVCTSVAKPRVQPAISEARSSSLDNVLNYLAFSRCTEQCMSLRRRLLQPGSRPISVRVEDLADLQRSAPLSWFQKGMDSALPCPVLQAATSRSLLLDQFVNLLEPSIPLPRRLPTQPRQAEGLISLISLFSHTFSATIRPHGGRNLRGAPSRARFMGRQI